MITCLHACMLACVYAYALSTCIACSYLLHACMVACLARVYADVIACITVPERALIAGVAASGESSSTLGSLM